MVVVVLWYFLVKKSRILYILFNFVIKMRFSKIFFSDAIRYVRFMRSCYLRWSNGLHAHSTVITSLFAASTQKAACKTAVSYCTQIPNWYFPINFLFRLVQRNYLIFRTKKQQKGRTAQFPFLLEKNGATKVNNAPGNNNNGYACVYCKPFVFQTACLLCMWNKENLKKSRC